MLLPVKGRLVYRQGPLNLNASFTKKIAILAAMFFSFLILVRNEWDSLPSLLSYCLFAASLLLLKEEILRRISSKKVAVELKDTSINKWEVASMAAKHMLGFRCAGSIREAEKELEKGFHGDALNLDVVASKTWNLAIPNDRPDIEGFTEQDKFLLWPQRVSDTVKTNFVHFWEEGVKMFIRNCGVERYPSFLLVRYDERGAYDTHYGNGLGKKGKQKVSPDHVLSLLPPPQEALEGEALVSYYSSTLMQAIHFHF